VSVPAATAAAAAAVATSLSHHESTAEFEILLDIPTEQELLELEGGDTEDGANEDGESPGKRRRVGEVSSSAGKGKKGRKKTKREEDAKKSDDELFIDEDQRLKDAVAECKCNCKCLKILEDTTIRGCVALWKVHQFNKKDKTSQDEMLLSWYSWSQRFPRDTKGHANWYFMPYDASDVISEAGADLRPLKNARMCTQSMYAVMQILRGRMKPIIKAYNTTGVVKKHGNKGNTNAMIKEDDPMMPPLRDHFEELSNLGEVRTTRLVATEVDDGTLATATRDDADVIYLPASDGYRPCYYRYMKDQGWKVKPLPNGTVTVQKDPTQEQKEYVSLATYYRIWIRDYPKLQVSKPAEDICDLCVRFANRHRYLAKHKCRCEGASATTEDAI
jgi:hypothetical protein